ncbi:hypothetical protein BC938DRAFT_478649, partial [Jimgerdemannia flammicorona]
DNTNLQRAFMVGILRIGKSDFLSSLNNVDVFPMTRAKYATSFGFTEDEVRLLLEHHNIEIPMSEVTDWYNGYLIGTQDNCHPLFNPWSIVCLCQHRELQPFCNESGGTITIQKMLPDASQEFKDAVLILAQHGSVNHSLNDRMSYEDLAQNNDQTLCMLLYYSGYLTINNDKFRVPNTEVQMEWLSWIIPVLSNPRIVADLLDLLVVCDMDRFKTEFEKVTVDSLSFHDVGGSRSGKRAEFYYHAFCLGFMLGLHRHGYHITSNQEAGFGRFDISAAPPSSGSLPAIIMEFKIEDLAQSALEQIITK